jgi:hypothetical protein
VEQKNHITQTTGVLGKSRLGNMPRRQAYKPSLCTERKGLNIMTKKLSFSFTGGGNSCLKLLNSSRPKE